jgi:hypothetical protein
MATNSEVSLRFGQRFQFRAQTLGSSHIRVGSHSLFLLVSICVNLVICLLFSAVPGVFGNQQNKYLEVIRQMLIHYLCDNSNEEVKTSAVKATAAFILCHETEKPVLKQMTDCVLPVIHVMSTCIDNETDDSALKSFIEISEKCPQILRPQFEALIELCLKTLSNTEKADSWRHLSLEVIISLAENAPSTVRKRGSPYLSHLSALSLSPIFTAFTKLWYPFSHSIASNDD